jgi:HEAT repeat protein
MAGSSLIPPTTGAGRTAAGLLAILLSACGPAAGAEAPAPPPAAAQTGEAAAELPQPSPAAARRVGELIERVRRAVNHQDREDAVAALVEVGPEALPLLVEELERRNRHTWPVMVYALGAIGDERALPYLAAELPAQSGTPYLEILYAMTLAGDEQALRQALRSTDATSIFEQGTTAIDYLAGSRGPEVVPLLVEEIPRRARDTRVAALGALGTIADARAVDFLLEWSRREEPTDRRYAVMALARIGDRRAIPRIVEALRDRDPKVREAAAEGAGYLRATEAVPTLVTMAKSRQATSSRSRAIWSLGLIGGQDAVRTLIEIEPRVHEIERPLVIQALGETRSPAAVEALSGAALGSDPRLSAFAIRGLRQLEDEDLRDTLLEICAEAPLHDVGLLAALGLVERKDPRATPCVVRRLKEEIDRRHGLGPVAEDLLVQLPLAGSASAADSLEALAEEIPAPALEHRLRTTARSIRLVEELGRDIEPWVSLLETGTPNEVDLAIRRLGDLGDTGALNPLIRLFGRIEPERSHLIPRALGEIGSERAVPFLISLLVDDLYYLVPALERAREEAAVTLAGFGEAEHAADALREAFLRDAGRSVVPLLAYARVAGAEAIPDLLELKTLLLRRRGREAVMMHERVNWAIRMLRAGRPIPTAEIRAASRWAR